MSEVKEFVIKNLRWIVLFICIVGFLAIAEDVFNQEIMQGDVIAYNIIVGNLRNEILTPIMKFITSIGGTITIIIVSILPILLIKNKKIGLCVIANTALVTGLNLVLKNIVQRPRPDGFRLISESGYSFPSGHSMISAAVYGFFVYLAYTYIKDKKLRNAVCIALSILIILIGISRIYLGVHYASDVCAGFLISISYLIVFVSILRRKVLNKENKNYGVEKEEKN